MIVAMIAGRLAGRSCVRWAVRFGGSFVAARGNLRSTLCVTPVPSCNFWASASSPLASAKSAARLVGPRSYRGLEHGSVDFPPRSGHLELQSLQVNLAEAVTAVGDLSVTVTARPGAALDDRVRVLEGNLTRLREEWHSGKNALRREVGALKEAVQTERAAQASGDDRTASKIEDLAVGGLHLEYVGVTLVAVRHNPQRFH